MNNKLFVYGTLAPGQPNHSVLKPLGGDWQRATLKGTLYDQGWGADQGCPGIVPSDEGDNVEGYVFTSDALPQFWAQLDAFEGDEYQRTAVTVTLSQDNSKVDAYVYAVTITEATPHTGAV
jgi:gamma-glutamylcyclotransferase (GGCT)/AIG2-like uncharacterized protein YtfP